MFIENKYSNWYKSIVERAKSRELGGYSEKHHIVPKSLGGNDTVENLVKLTAREHFICHLLLVKMTDGVFRKKMLYAVWAFIRASKSQQRIKITGRRYEILRKQFVDMMVTSKHGSWNKGRQVTEETRRKLSIAGKGKTRSEDTKRKMSESFKGRIPWNKNNPGVFEHTEETRKRMSETKLNMTPEARSAWVGKMSEDRKGKTTAYDLSLQKVVRVPVEEFRKYKNERYVGLNSKLRPR